ncbi:hypothetical protein LG634_03455 [Streptomyces bambusae]|uniref:hypothetical protein n=1 Tax=Streptomyces bambusae TaxID=1550616 RepID=UPI001CFC6AF9|nr:hypothetical protein [Streptomyces bambusae]MCB5163895.1 hypothetical protein [Streptomyces bambusae]
MALGAAAAGLRAAGPVARRVPGIEGPGPLTAWGLPVARLAADVSAVATVGALLLAGVLLPGGRGLGPARLPYVSGAAAAAGVWSVS